MKEALFYNKLKDKILQCKLCPHFCVLKENEIGKCMIRRNVNGILYSMSYEKPVAIHIDPIEKKPLFHFIPGTKSYSIGMAGCNFKCEHCQNFEISQRGAEEIPVPNVKAEEMIERTLKSKCPSISYTYTEPLISYEYVFDIAKLARKKGIKNIIVSNGFINPEPLKELCKYLDGANIDIKGNDKFYKEICKGRLEPVLEAIKILYKENVWVELTNLIIPGYNDNKKEIEKICKWIMDNLGSDVPLHFSRFFPMYKLTNIKETLEETLIMARDIAKEIGLNYVYIGNIFIDKAENTYCPKCNRLMIERVGFEVLQNNIKKGKCECGQRIAGVWE